MFSQKSMLTIRGFSDQDSEPEIISLLSKYGTLSNLEIIRPKDSKSKKSVLAYYQEESQADLARSSLHNQKFGQNYLFVDYFDPYSKYFSSDPAFQSNKVIQRGGIRNKDDPEKKIFKFTEIDQDRKNEKTMLYTKKNLEKMITTNTRLSSGAVPSDSKDFMKAPVMTQNYYINGTMNNQQNVYLKSQINFIHFLPPFVQGHSSVPTIEQIKRSYLEKPEVDPLKNQSTKSNYKENTFKQDNFKSENSDIKGDNVLDKKTVSLEKALKPKETFPIYDIKPKETSQTSQIPSKPLQKPLQPLQKPLQPLSNPFQPLSKAQQPPLKTFQPKPLPTKPSVLKNINVNNVNPQAKLPQTLPKPLIKPEEPIKTPSDRFRELFAKNNLDFNEVLLHCQDGNELRRLYHKFLHEFLHHSHKTHPVCFNPEGPNLSESSHNSHKLLLLHEEDHIKFEKRDSRSKNNKRQRDYKQEKELLQFEYGSKNVKRKEIGIEDIRKGDYEVKKELIEKEGGICDQKPASEEKPLNEFLNEGKNLINEGKNLINEEKNLSNEGKGIVNQEKSEEKINQDCSFKLNEIKVPLNEQAHISNIQNILSQSKDPKTDCKLEEKIEIEEKIESSNPENPTFFVSSLQEAAKNKKLKNLLNFMMNGGDLTHLKQNLLKKQACKTEPKNP